MKSINTRFVLSRFFGALILLLAIIGIGYSLLLIVRGSAWNSVSVVEPGEVLPAPQIVYYRDPEAVVPLFANGLIIAAILTSRKRLAWLGWGIQLVFSGLFIFSIGLLFLRLSLLLVIPLLFIPPGLSRKGFGQEKSQIE